MLVQDQNNKLVVTPSSPRASAAELILSCVEQTAFVRYQIIEMEVLKLILKSEEKKRKNVILQTHIPLNRGKQ